MTSLLPAADLPSEDEEDPDFSPAELPVADNVSSHKRKRAADGALQQGWMTQLGLSQVKPPAIESSQQEGFKPAAAAHIGPPVVDPGVRARAVAAAAKALQQKPLAQAGTGIVPRATGSKPSQTSGAAGLSQAVKAASADQEGQQAAKKHVEGLDQALNLTQAARQANVLDRSRTDWDQFKSADQHVDEELEAYKRSGAKYLDRQDFMQRTELRQYEKDRDQRLGTTRTPQS